MSKTENELPATLLRWTIPSGWRWISIGEVGKIVTGNTPSTKDPSNYGNDIPFVKPPELIDKGIRFAADSLSTKGTRSARVLPAGAVLVSCIGGLGKTGLAKVPIAFNQQINAVIFDERVLPEFGFYYAQTLKEWLYGVASATTLPIVNKGKFQRAPFPLAPLSEQKRIVAEIEKQFSRLDEAVANLRRVKANLKRYKAAVLKAAVKGKLTEEWRKAHPDVEPATELLKHILAERRAKWNGKGKYNEPAPPDTRGLPLLPERWTWASADQLSLKITDGEHLSPKTLEFGVPLLSAKDVRENGVTFAEVKYVAREDADRFRNRCDPAQGDILIVSRGATIGRTCRVDTDVVFCLMGSVILIKPLSFVDTGFLLTALKSSSSHRLLRGISGSTAQQAIYIRDIRSIPIPLPPLDEQTQVFSVIEAGISNANSVDAAIDANFRRAERLRRSILSRAFCGGLARVNGALDWSERL